MASCLVMLLCTVCVIYCIYTYIYICTAGKCTIGVWTAATTAVMHMYTIHVGKYLPVVHIAKVCNLSVLVLGNLALFI